MGSQKKRAQESEKTKALNSVLVAVLLSSRCENTYFMRSVAAGNIFAMTCSEFVEIYLIRINISKSRKRTLQEVRWAVEEYG